MSMRGVYFSCITDVNIMCPVVKKNNDESLTFLFKATLHFRLREKCLPI